MIKAFVGSMTARIFLILVVGTIVSVGLVMALATYERRNLEANMRIARTAERVEQIILMLDAVPKASRGALANVAEKYGIKVDLTNSTALIGKFPDNEFSTVLRQTLGETRSITVVDSESKDCPARKFDHELPANQIRHCQKIFTTLKDGTPLRLDISHRDRPSIPFQGNFVRDSILFLSGILLVALFVAHMATKPLRRLAQAAQNLGRNIEHPALSEHQGSTEVREASVAFNSMQTSIRSHLQERTYMLAAIAHDLQTPLTRLRLRLEKVTDEDLREKLVADMTATLAMVKEGLEFARSTNIEEPFDLVDVDSLIEAICNDATDAGSEVTCSGKIGKPILACPHILRRCITNLLDNAIKYGGFAQVIVRQENSKVIISIMDGGMGIPDDQLESVFQPFKRIENSRSRTSGGTGLGLTIARIIAEKHRGSITLSNIGTPELGLMATLELPTA